MKEHFRQSMAWLHTWAGLVLGWVLFFMFVTGTAGYVDTEIDRWMRPERPYTAHAIPAAEAAALAQARLQRQAPAAEHWTIALPGHRENPDLRVAWRAQPAADGKRPKESKEILDPASGEAVAGRETGGGQVLYQMHWRLHYLEREVSDWLAGIAAMFMLVALVSGVVIHKKIFADFFTFRPGKGQRSWLDAHNAASVLSLPFLAMITYSGLVFLSSSDMPLIVAAGYGPGEAGRKAYQAELAPPVAQVPPARAAVPLLPLAPLVAEAERRWGEGRVLSIEVRQPGDANARVIFQRHQDTPLRSRERLVFDGASGQPLEAQPALASTAKAVRDVLLGLHEGLFAGPLLRGLYFLSGLTGAAMVATGLVLWTVKRRQRQERSGAPHAGLALVERLNLGTLVGLPLAVAAYFWANRLLPADMAGRGEWEVHTLFVAWGLALLYPLARPLRRAWVELAAMAAAAFALLPLVNAAATGRHLGASLARGDWVFAGFDLAMLAFGFLFAALAAALRRRWAAGGAHPPAVAPKAAAALREGAAAR